MKVGRVAIITRGRYAGKKVGSIYSFLLLFTFGGQALGKYMWQLRYDPIVG